MRSLKQYSLKTKLALFVTVILWASAFVGIRIGLKGYTPGGLALLRFFIASIFILLVCTRLPTRTAIPWRDRIFLLLIGMFGIGLYNIALNSGEIAVSSGIASFIISLSPVITLFLAIFCLNESFNRTMIIGMTVSILGAALLMLGEGTQFNSYAGVVYVFIGTVISGIYSVVQKPWLKKYHFLEVTAHIVIGAVLLLLFYLPDVITNLRTAPLSATLAVIYLGIFPAAIGYLAWSYVLIEMPASQAANFLYFMPIIATFLGWICLKEVPLLLSLLGGFIALLGVCIANHSRRGPNITPLE